MGLGGSVPPGLALESVRRRGMMAPRLLIKLRSWGLRWPCLGLGALTTRLRQHSSRLQRRGVMNALPMRSPGSPKGRIPPWPEFGASGAPETLGTLFNTLMYETGLKPSLNASSDLDPFPLLNPVVSASPPGFLLPSLVRRPEWP